MHASQAGLLFERQIIHKQPDRESFHFNLVTVNKNLETRNMPSKQDNMDINISPEQERKSFLEIRLVEEHDIETAPPPGPPNKVHSIMRIIYSLTCICIHPELWSLNCYVSVQNTSHPSP